ncbi:MAG: energy transducer TonB [Bacteroidales bacterium]|nr:energy transducer TonB [Bacteroidales bacterium]
MKKLFTLLLFTAAFSMAYAQQPASNNTTDDDVIFSIVENEPEYPGGDEALYKFIGKNIVYPKSAREKGIQGTVIVEFVIEKDGKLSNIKVVRSADPALDAEAVRVISKMPKWKPGTQRGKKVRSTFRLPINFQLD